MLPHATVTPPAPFSSVSHELKAPELEQTVIGSPLKKQRASLSGLDDETMRQRLGLGLSGVLEQDKDKDIKREEKDEEL